MVEHPAQVVRDHVERPTAVAVLESSGSIQEVFAALADEVDGFAGLYYDHEGRRTVTMTDTDRIEDVRAPVSSVLRAGLRGQESLPGYTAAREQIDQDVSELRAELAQFDYRQLYDWYHGQIVNEVGGLSSVTSMHIDERLNRILVGVEHWADIPDIEHRLEALSVPELALEVRQSGVSGSSTGLARTFVIARWDSTCIGLFRMDPCTRTATSS